MIITNIKRAEVYTQKLTNDMMLCCVVLWERQREGEVNMEIVGWDMCCGRLKVDMKNVTSTWMFESSRRFSTV